MGAIKKMRYIQTDIWDKSWFRELGYKGRYLYLYLLTCPSSNIAGIMEITEDRIKFDTGLTNIKSSMKKIEDAGEIYQIGGYIVVHRHPDFQKWEQKPNLCKGIIKELEDVPIEVFKEIRSRGYHFALLYEEHSTMAFIEKMNEKKQDYLPRKFIERCEYREIGKPFETLSNPFHYTDTDTDTDTDSDSYFELESYATRSNNPEFKHFLLLYDKMYYEQFGERHKKITREQFEKAREVLEGNSVFSMDRSTQEEMIQDFFENVKSSDYSLLHFATDGILELRTIRTM